MNLELELVLLFDGLSWEEKEEGEDEEEEKAGSELGLKGRLWLTRVHELSRRFIGNFG